MTVDSSPVHLPTVGAHRIDPRRCTVSYSGRHLFGLGTVHATFDLTDGEVRVQDPVEASTVAARIDPATFSSGNARRDRDVVGAGLLDCSNHPEIRFVSSGLRQDDVRWVLSGTVTAHGHDVPVDVVIDRAQLDLDLDVVARRVRARRV